jgi:hypothetical protein
VPDKNWTYIIGKEASRSASTDILSNFLDSKFGLTPPHFFPGEHENLLLRKNVKRELKYTIGAVPIDLEFPGSR